MKVAFIGDSFCAYDEPESWTSILCNRLDAEIISLGRSGSNIWDAHKQLIKNIDAADVVCFCHTDRHRLPNQHDWPINAASVTYFREGNTKPSHSLRTFTDVRVWQAADLYYQHIYADGYHALTQRLIIQDMGQIAAERSKYSVHMFCFDEPFLQFSNSSTLNISLNSWLISCGKQNLDMDNDYNHMSYGMNQHVAEKVYEQIMQQHCGSFSLDVIPYIG